MAVAVECLNCYCDLTILSQSQLISCQNGHSQLCYDCMLKWRSECLNHYRVVTCPMCRAEFSQEQLNKLGGVNSDELVITNSSPRLIYSHIDATGRVVRSTTLTLAGSDFDGDDVPIFHNFLIDPEDSISSLTVSYTMGESFNPPERRYRGITANNYRGYQTSAESQPVGLTLPDVA